MGRGTRAASERSLADPEPGRARRPSARASDGLFVLAVLALLSPIALRFLGSEPAGSPVEGPRSTSADGPRSPLPAAKLALPARNGDERRAVDAQAVREHPGGITPAAAAGAMVAAPPAELLIRVIDAARRAPLENASVEIAKSLEGTASPTLEVLHTDARGEVALMLDPCSLRAVAWRADAIGGPVGAELASGRTTELVITLEPALAVEGRVVSACDGAPIPGARVSFWTFSELDCATTDAAGLFVHPRFPRSAYAEQVRVEAPGFGASVRFLAVDEHAGWELAAPVASEASQLGTGIPSLEIELVPELVVEGSVVGPGGEPIAGALVTAEGYVRLLPEVASRDAAEARSDERGRFRLAGLRSDVSHALSVRAVGFASHHGEMSAALGEDRVELGALALELGRVVAGVVLDAEGFPVADAALELELRPRVHGESSDQDARALDAGARVLGTSLTARTDMDGVFVLDGVPAGEFELWVARDRERLVATRVSTLHGDAQELLLYLPPSALTLRGVVRDEGAGVPGAAVEVWRDGLVGRVTTDLKGFFRLAGLDDADVYDVTASFASGSAAELRTAHVSVYGFAAPVLELSRP